MKPTAFLINTARGRVVCENALVGALRDRRIAGAGLDVFADEPLPADHPLLELENVVCTAHTGGTDSLCATRWRCRRLSRLSPSAKGSGPKHKWSIPTPGQGFAGRKTRHVGIECGQLALRVAVGGACLHRQQDGCHTEPPHPTMAVNSQSELTT